MLLSDSAWRHPRHREHRRDDPLLVRRDIKEQHLLWTLPARTLAQEELDMLDGRVGRAARQPSVAGDGDLIALHRLPGGKVDAVGERRRTMDVTTPIVTATSVPDR
jgi:hypothetical protein